MRVGFTGTSKRSLTDKQAAELRSFLEALRPTAFLHGACINADNEADMIAVSLLIPRFIFPQSTRPSMRVPDIAFLARRGPNGEKVDVLFAPPAPPLERNAAIVRNCSVLVACPSTSHERIRSGTWATVRLARKELGEEWVRIIEP